MNQSKLEESTNRRCWARENACEQVTTCFGFLIGWENWVRFFQPITKLRNAKPKQTRITFNTQLKIALYVTVNQFTSEISRFFRESTGHRYHALFGQMERDRSRCLLLISVIHLPWLLWRGPGTSLGSGARRSDTWRDMLKEGHPGRVRWRAEL